MFENLTQYATRNREKLLKNILIKGEQNPTYLNYLEQPMEFNINSPLDETLILLRTLYSTNDLIFIGNKYAKEIDAVSNWIEKFENLKSKDPAIVGELYPFIIPNTLSGREEVVSSGKTSKRCDACVSGFNFFVGEFDGLSKEDQIKFWWGIGLPVIALTDSCNKSVHAWVKVSDVNTKDQWDADVKNGIFKLLGIYGIDTQCSNPARLSRLAGVYRSSTHKYQKLLFINANGGLK